MSQGRTSVPDALVITGCGILSPLGIGFDAFAAALNARHAAPRREMELGHDSLRCEVPDFDARTFLGKKGTAFLDRLTTLTVAACRLALETSGGVPLEQYRDEVGVVLGSSMGSVNSIAGFTRETLIQERPYLVNAILFPNTVMNCAAGQTAIWLGLRGVNCTVGGGQTASLLALRYACTMLRRRHAAAVLVGGAEEFSLPQAWAFRLAGLLPSVLPIGEGCAIFRMERWEDAQAAGRVPMAEVLACETGLYTEDERASGFAECIRRTIARAGIGPNDIGAVAGSFRGDAVLDPLEAAAIVHNLGQMPLSIPIKPLVGECYSAAGALQLAAVLAWYRAQPAGQARYGLVTSIGYSGLVACALIKEWIP